MTDIVERLNREVAHPAFAGKVQVLANQSTLREAADEILRLRKETEKYRRISELKSHAIGRYIPCPDHRDKRNRGDECEMCRRERAERRATRAEGRVEELTKALAGLLADIAGLMNESDGVYGLHLNGDPAPWGELDEGGQFERLTHLSMAHAALSSTKS